MPLEKAVLVNEATGERVPVQFNPEEYTHTRENQFAAATVPGRGAPLLQFVSGGLKTLEMELFVDTHEEHREGSRLLNQAGEDVRKFTAALSGLMDIAPDLHAPPLLVFVWGQLSFRCVLAKLTQRFILFRPDGVPVRARLQVSLHEFVSAEGEAKAVKRQTADYSKVYVVGLGETLSGIAARLYDDPAQWRPIALRNAIDDPRALPVGLQLVIPQLPFHDPETGEVMG